MESATLALGVESARPTLHNYLQPENGGTKSSVYEAVAGEVPLCSTICIAGLAQEIIGKTRYINIINIYTVNYRIARSHWPSLYDK